jgi:hypothetical protein
VLIDNSLSDHPVIVRNERETRCPNPASSWGGLRSGPVDLMLSAGMRTGLLPSRVSVEAPERGSGGTESGVVLRKQDR